MIKKIVVFGMNYIGDSLFVTPLIRSIKKHYGDECVIDVINGGRGSDVLINNKDISNIIVRPTDKQEYEMYLNNIKDTNYDIAFIANTNFLSAWEAWKAKVPIRVGLDSDMRAILLTNVVKHKKFSTHIIDGILSILEPLNIKIATTKTSITLSDDENEYAKNIMKQFDKSLVVHAGATRLSKRYPTEKFAEVISMFYEKTQIATVLIGGPDDVELSSNIERLAKPNSIGLNVTGKTSIRQMISIIKYGYIFLGGDSAPLHIANAFDLYTVGIYGDTLPIMYGVRGEKSINIEARHNCSNAIKNFHCTYMKRGCKTIECLKNIESESVLNTMLELLQFNS